MKDKRARSSRTSQHIGKENARARRIAQGSEQQKLNPQLIRAVRTAKVDLRRKKKEEDMDH